MALNKGANGFLNSQGKKRKEKIRKRKTKRSREKPPRSSPWRSPVWSPKTLQEPWKSIGRPTNRQTDKETGRGKGRSMRGGAVQLHRLGTSSFHFMLKAVPAMRESRLLVSEHHQNGCEWIRPVHASVCVRVCVYMRMSEFFEAISALRFLLSALPWPCRDSACYSICV